MEIIFLKLSKFLGKFVRLFIQQLQTMRRIYCHIHVQFSFVSTEKNDVSLAMHASHLIAVFQRSE